MKVTEEQAIKQKKCPMALGGSFASASAYKCVGSDCMAWVWSMVKDQNGLSSTVSKAKLIAAFGYNHLGACEALPKA